MPTSALLLYLLDRGEVISSELLRSIATSDDNVELYQRALSAGADLGNGEVLELINQGAYKILNRLVLPFLGAQWPAGKIEEVLETDQYQHNYDKERLRRQLRWLQAHGYGPSTRKADVRDLLSLSRIGWKF